METKLDLIAERAKGQKDAPHRVWAILQTKRAGEGSQTGGALPILRHQRELQEYGEVPMGRFEAGFEVVEPEESEEKFQLGNVPPVYGKIPVTETGYLPHLL
jgi:hypothetical protein